MGQTQLISLWLTHVWFGQEVHGGLTVMGHVSFITQQASPDFLMWGFPAFKKNMVANSQVRVLFKVLLVSFCLCPIRQSKSHCQAENWSEGWKQAGTNRV